MSHIPNLQGRPRQACLTLYALHGRATAGEVCAAAGIRETESNKIMRRLVSAGCAEVAEDGYPRVYALTAMGRSFALAAIDDEDLSTDHLFECNRSEPRTALPRAPWQQLQGVWR